MTGSPREGLARLRGARESGQLTALCRRRGIALLTVFGSTVTRSAAPRDLDVAVGYSGGPRADHLTLLDELSDMAGTEVDLLVLDDAGPVARERALVGCTLLYEAHPGLFAAAQMSAMTHRMDTDWMRRLDLELLSR